jgi:hypothetical protein
MWSLRRKNSSTIAKPTKAAPSEVTEYYKAEKRDRLWGVWLLSLATFFGTLVVVLGLFWGGRWVYHQFTDKKKPETVSVGQKPQSVNKVGSSSASTSTTTNPNLQGSVPAVTTPTTPSPTISSTPKPTPTTPANNSQQLVNTGPTSDE